MAGLLQFTLGLTTGGFLSAVAGADKQIKGFIGGLVGLGAVTAGVWNQIEKGAALKGLSDRTGESVSNVFRLQKGLRAVGLDASDAGNMLYQLQRSLGGVSETGEPTAYVFAQLGLQIDKLKRMDAPTALSTIAAKLATLDNASATAASGKIFGRYSAREFLQLARNTDAFTRALHGSQTQAAIFQRYAETFHQIELGVSRLKDKTSGLFLGVAAGIAPALQTVIQMLDAIDLSKIGASIGTILTGFTQAFREGKLSELIADSLKLGFESIVIFAPAIFEKVGYLLLKAFETPLIYIQAGMEYALEKAVHAFATNPTFHAILQAVAPGAGDALSLLTGGDTGAVSWKDVLGNAKQSGLRFNLGTGEFGLGDMNAGADERLKEALSKFRAAYKPWWDEVTGFATRATKGLNEDKKADQKNTLGAAYRIERTALEKMGFVFRGGVGAGDPAHETARNTKDLVGLTRQLVGKLGVGQGLSLTNAHA